MVVAKQPKRMLWHGPKNRVGVGLHDDEGNQDYWTYPDHHGDPTRSYEDS